MTQEPTDTRPADGMAALGNMFGVAAHGDGWPAVKAARLEALELARRRAERQDRAEHFNALLSRITAVVIVVAVIGILAALCVAAWRWAL
jgi:hypothetical protein